MHILTILFAQDFGDEGKTYQTLLGNIVRFMKKEQPEKFEEINIDIDHILEEISDEEILQLKSLGLM